MRAAGYVRVSTVRQASEGLSLEAQERRVRDRIAAEGWELTKVYVEAGVSGRRDDRPELQRLLANLDSIDRLVIPKLDRLGRSNRDLHNLFARLEEAGVELVSIGDSIDTASAGGKLMRAILTALAEFESDTIGERVKAVAGGRVEDGKHHGRAPYGYRSEGGDLVPVPEQATVVREMFEMAAAGVSQRQIAQRLNQRGDRTQRSGRWSQPSIRKMLANPTYKGEVEVHGQTFHGDHAAIVPPELWEKVAQLREATARTRNGGPGRTPAGRHLFIRGILHCGHCGGTMLPRRNPSHADGTRYEVYHCATRLQVGVDACDMEPIPREALDAPTFRYFEEVALDVEAMRQQLREQVDRRLQGARERMRAARDERDRYTAARKRLEDDFTGDKIGSEEWVEKDRGLKHRQDDAERAREHIAAEVEQLTEVASANVETEAARRLSELKAAIAGEVTSAADIDAVRAALQRLFDHFQVFRVAPEATGQHPPEVRAIIEAHQREFEASVEQWENEGELYPAGEYVILPHARVRTVEELAMPTRMVLKRMPLDTASEKGSVGLTT
jgi:DNA invertase Pin-like site-specific DNA recombinase